MKDFEAEAHRDINRMSKAILWLIWSCVACVVVGLGVSVFFACWAGLWLMGAIG